MSQAEVTSPQPGSEAEAAATRKAWPALWAMVIGFFMILMDTTMVSIATRALIVDLQADVTTVLWVTSAYLLAYVVPLLITGRLGDRFGPRRIYLIGLAVFTLASLWCGLSGNVETLVAARVAQGLGAAMMVPQTMSVITRTFPRSARGQASALWGATAGVAMLVGPLLGGLLIGTLGWRWMFFINIPVGIVGFVMAWRLVPRLPLLSRSFDWIGVALSAVGLFLLVFGIQEGETFQWGTITGIISVPAIIVAGVVILAIFAWWQSRAPEPLVPARLFALRNFTLSTFAVGLISLATTAFAIPMSLFAQGVYRFTEFETALVLLPMAFAALILARPVGKWTDRVSPRRILIPGMVLSAAAFLLLSIFSRADSPVWIYAAAMGLLGVGNAMIWGPLAASSNRDLPMDIAGAGAGTYNLGRQLGGVLGAATVAALLSSRMQALGLPGGNALQEDLKNGFPAQLTDAFATATGQTMLLPAAAMVLGAVVVCFMGPNSNNEGATDAKAVATAAAKS